MTTQLPPFYGHRAAGILAHFVINATQMCIDCYQESYMKLQLQQYLVMIISGSSF